MIVEFYRFYKAEGCKRVRAQGSLYVFNVMYIFLRDGCGSGGGEVDLQVR